MVLMEDNEVSIGALATYILHNSKTQIDAILETDQKEMLDFRMDRANDSRPRHTLR